MELVKAKKHLGQHFLKDLNIAQKIADTLSLANYKKVWAFLRNSYSKKIHKYM